MAATSPPHGLGRFFKVAPKSGGSPPTTPSPGAPSHAAAAVQPEVSTPPSSDPPMSRKRSTGAAQSSAAQEAKKRKSAGVSTAPAKNEPAEQDEPMDEAEGGDSPAAAQQEGAAQSGGSPTDLRAALQQASRAGGLPSFTAECFHHYTSAQNLYSWPTWLKPENWRDRGGKKPDEPGFEAGTLTVHDEKRQKDEGHGTPMLLQYWKVKAVHFDKVAFFKVGKFYEIFYYDAFIAQHVCGLKWMNGDKKPHVGFPEMAKHDYAKRIVDAGYKVVVVEQTERVQENKQRSVEAGGSTAGTCIERAACEVFTKGSVVDTEMIGGASARFMVYFHFEEGVSRQPTNMSKSDRSFSVCLVDAATSQLSLARVVDGPDRNALRTLLAQVQPSEVVYSSANLPAEVAGLFRRLPCRPQQSTLTAPELTQLAANGKLASYRKAHPGKIPAHVEEVIKADAGSAATAAAGALEYLEDVLLSSRVLPFAVWDVLDLPTAPPANQPTDRPKSTSVGKRMVLDATALSALEVLETLEGTYKGSLLEFLDHTSTPFGYRFLKQWLCAPLLDIGEIRARHEAVEFFLTRPDLAQKARTRLKAVDVDLERATSRVWGYALQSERNAVMYSDITAKRLKEFADLLQAYQACCDVLTSTISDASLPSRLQQIARTKDAGGNLPDLREVIERLRGSVVTTTDAKGATKYRPRDGADAQYDAIGREIKNVKVNLDKEMTKMRGQLKGVELTWVHRQPGFSYEIEADDKAVTEKFLTQQVEQTSRLKNKVRFQTAEIKQLVEKLDHLKDRLEDCLWPFLSKVFQEFYAHQAQFRAAARMVAEVDALLSLSFASAGMSGSCLPEFVEQAPDAVGLLELRKCQHPVAAMKMGAAFVPNDTVLNTCDVPGVLIVTGPNMGGKSTVLRQTCIAVVMAQLGCRVSAEKCRLSPFDRIFTRIGSYDTILEGKSTLLTELEETAAVLAHGTKRSLAVLDELGRGTSTFDGAAIAAAVLDDLADRVGCLALFATHYHPVSREAARRKNIAPFHMAASLDEATQEMTFLYRFLPGLCPASHGHNVAKLAGLPANVVAEAAAKSAEFESSEAGAKGALALAELARFAGAGDVDALRTLYLEQKKQAGAASAL